MMTKSKHFQNLIIILCLLLKIIVSSIYCKKCWWNIYIFKVMSQ